MLNMTLLKFSLHFQVYYNVCKNIKQTIKYIHNKFVKIRHCVYFFY